MSNPLYADQVITKVYDPDNNALRVNDVTGSGSTPNTNGSISNFPVTTSPHTFSPPANAVGFILQSESTNTANIRWAIGGTASSSIGNLYEPGRDTGFISCAAPISVVAMSATQDVSVQWILSS